MSLKKQSAKREISHLKCEYMEHPNGKKVGDHVLEPAITTFNKRVLYSTYDITDQLRMTASVLNMITTRMYGQLTHSKEKDPRCMNPGFSIRDTDMSKQKLIVPKKYIHYLYNLARSDANPEENLVINDFGGYWDSLGEWCAPGQWDGPIHSVVNTAFAATVHPEYRCQMRSFKLYRALVT